MCSIMEGHVRGGLQESPVKHLNGNQLLPVVSSRMGYCHKQINGLVCFESGYYGKYLYDWPYASPVMNQAVTPPSSPAASCQLQWTIYTTLTQIYSMTGLVWLFEDFYDYSGTLYPGGNYLNFTPPGIVINRFGAPYTQIIYNETCTAVSGMSGNCPTSGGYPTSVQPITGAGSNHQWGYASPTLFNISTNFYNDGSVTNYLWDIYSGGPGFIYNAPSHSFKGRLLNQFSGAVDLVGIFNSCKSDFFGRAFSNTWSTAFVNIYYKDCVATNGMDASTVSPSTYDSSIQTSGPVGTSVSLPSGIAAACGWAISSGAAGSGGGLVIFRGQAMLDGSISQPYNTPFFIGRSRKMSPNQPLWDANGNSISWPNPYPTGSLSLLRSGMMNPGDIIANESTGIFNLPFPANGPFPISSYADSPITQDMYFVVIGQDPASWAKQYGYVFDQTTDNSNITADNTQTI